jgi:DNA-binding SARP family transcriptional activator
VRAQALLAEATGLALAMGRRMQQVRCIELAARVACAGREYERAARLYGAAEAGRAMIDQGPPRSALRAVAQADLAGLRAALGPAALAGSWEEGRRLSIDQACALVLGARSAVDDAPPGRAEGPKPAPPWRLRLLGDVIVEAHGRPVELRGRALAQVVTMAALRGPVPVDEVVDTLWPDAGPGLGRRRLNNVLARLRRNCGDLVVRREDALRLAPGTDLDVAAFEEAAGAALDAARSGKPDAGAMCLEAVVLYQGELLPGDRYEDWTVSRRVRLARLHLDLLDALAESAAAAGRPGEAVAWLERAIDAEPLDQARYRRAAEIMVDQGWRHRARALALRARRMTDELGVAIPSDLAALLPDH